MSDTTDNESSGALSPSGRFARMEAALERIENKLDQKAEITEVAAIATRVFVLEIDRESRAAVSAANEKAAEARYRVVWLVVGFLTIINVALGIVLSLVAIGPFGPIQ